MKAPDLSSVEDAGVHAWSGSVEPLKTAAAHANLKLSVVDLSHAEGSRRAVRASSTARSGFPSTSATTGTRSPTCSRTATGSARAAASSSSPAPPRIARDHPTDWATLEDILAEACEFWQERHMPFWVFTVK